jgi:hypothetical protein
MHLTKDFVHHRIGALAANVIAELRFDHRESRLNVAADSAPRTRRGETETGGTSSARDLAVSLRGNG